MSLISPDGTHPSNSIGLLCPGLTIHLDGSVRVRLSTTTWLVSTSISVAELTSRSVVAVFLIIPLANVRVSGTAFSYSVRTLVLIQVYSISTPSQIKVSVISFSGTYSSSCEIGKASKTVQMIAVTDAMIIGGMKLRDLAGLTDSESWLSGFDFWFWSLIILYSQHACKRPQEEYKARARVLATAQRAT